MNTFGFEYLPGNVKKHYQSFIKRKNRNSVKQSEIITYQPKTFQKFVFFYKLC